MSGFVNFVSTLPLAAPDSAAAQAACDCLEWLEAGQHPTDFFAQ